ncbi:MAG: hypothetical protein ACRDD7_14115, partial [Peptostreptococcaceae bacterium]
GKIYEELKTSIHNNIACCVPTLQNTAKETGKNYYYNFNGHILYSDTVTLDSAYKEITGMTYTEYIEYEEQNLSKWKKEKEEHKARIPELTKEYIEKAKGIIAEDKLDIWNETVPVKLRDIYEGMELECTLKIIKLLNENKFEEAKEEIHNQNHSGMSFGLVCNMLVAFSDKGTEFVNMVK